MNILFIYSLQEVQSIKKPIRMQIQLQLGISLISSVLKKNKHDTQVAVISKVFKEKNKRTIDENINKFSPKLICYTATSCEYDFIKEIAGYVKASHPNIYSLIGGCHVSLNPEGVLSGPFDALCIGEGEYPTLELASQLESGRKPSKIKNLWIKNDVGIEKNSTRPFVQDLDSLPFPDREIWQPWTNEQLGSKIPVLLGRGCPFECTYCCNDCLSKLAQGPYVRFRSPDNILAEIKSIINKFPTIKEFRLEVESLGLNKDWAVELCSKLEGFNKTLNEPLSFESNLRIVPNSDFKDLFRAMKQANFKSINIGLESGSDKVRKKILKRIYKNEDVINTCSLAKKYGLSVGLFNMIGIPGETREDYKKTVEINRVCKPDYHYTSIFFPYPGTKLYSLCKEMGLIKGDLKTKMERKEALLDLPDFNRKQIKKSYVWFDYYVYKGYKPLYKILPKIFLNGISSNPSLYLFFRKIVHLPILKYIRLYYAKS